MTRRVLITGANRGIGLEFARHYAQAGCHVIGTTRSLESAQELLAIPGVSVLRLDCRSNESLRTFADSLPLEPLHLLINNAGILEVASLLETTPEQMHDHYQVNTGSYLPCTQNKFPWTDFPHAPPVAPLMTVQTLLPRLKLAGSEAKVINITSRVGSIADNTSGGYVAYRASKTALNMVTKTMAIEIPDITFLALHPGYIQTRMVNFSGDMPPDEAVQRMAKVIDKLDHSQSGSFVHRDDHIIPY